MSLMNSHHMKGVPCFNDFVRFFIYLLVAALILFFIIIPLVDKVAQPDPIKSAAEHGHFKPMTKDFKITDEKIILEDINIGGETKTINTIIFGGHFIKTRDCDFLVMNATNFEGGLVFDYRRRKLTQPDIEEPITSRPKGMNYFNNWKIQGVESMCGVRIVSNHQCTPLQKTITVVKDYYDGNCDEARDN